MLGVECILYVYIKRSITAICNEREADRKRQCFNNLNSGQLKSTLLKMCFQSDGMQTVTSGCINFSFQMQSSSAAVHQTMYETFSTSRKVADTARHRCMFLGDWDLYETLGLMTLSWWITEFLLPIFLFFHVLQREIRVF